MKFELQNKIEKEFGVLSQEYRNCRKNNRGVPVAAIIIQNEMIIKGFFNKKSKNHKDDLTHAEYLCIEYIKEHNLQNISIVVTMSPCEKCCRAIDESDLINCVYYIKLNRRRNKRFLDKYQEVKQYECYIPKEHPNILWWKKEMRKHKWNIIRKHSCNSL